MTDPRWVADPGIRWRIVLTARRGTPWNVSEVGAGLVRLTTAQHWPAAAAPQVDDDLDGLRARLAEVEDGPVALGVAGTDLVISAHHSWVDGLGLLDVLAGVTTERVTSSARGVTDRPRRSGFALAAARRMGEVALAPPARVAAPARSPVGRAGDVFVTGELPGKVRTAELVSAAVRAVVGHNEAAGRRTRHVAVAVGASRRAPGDDEIADRSALIRLRDLERRDSAEIADLIRSAPLEPPVAPGATSGRVVGLALRALAPRLGSTVLVSHLGEVSAPGISGLSFHPVTAGGTGLSLGAVGLAGRTTLGLRARAADWDHDSLRGLLVRILGELNG